MNLPTYENDHFVLDDAVEIHNENPDTFWIPSNEEKNNLSVGSIVKLIFSMEVSAGSDEASTERMWVEILNIEHDVFTGRLDNEPNGSDCVNCDYVFNFNSCHIIDIYSKDT